MTLFLRRFGSPFSALVTRPNRAGLGFPADRCRRHGNMKVEGVEGIDGMSMQSTVAHGIGVVKAGDAKAGSIILSYGPIAELHWSAMTMPFVVADDKFLAGIRGKQKVVFTFCAEGGTNTITEIKPVK